MSDQVKTRVKLTVSFEVECGIGDAWQMRKALRERPGVAGVWLRLRMLQALAGFLGDLTGGDADLISKTLTVSGGSIAEVKE